MDTDEEAALSVLAGDLPAQADDDEMGEELTLYEMDDIEAVDDDDPFSPTDFPVRSRTGPSLLSRLHLKSRMIQAGVCLALVVVVVVIAVAITVGVTYQLSPHDSTKKEKEANQNPSFDPDDHDLLVDMFIDFGLDTINEEAMRAAIMVLESLSMLSPSGVSSIPSVLRVCVSKTLTSHFFGKFLSDDLLEGRGTGSRGEALSAAFVEASLMECGCETNIQEVSLRGETPATVDTLVITADGSDSMSFEWKDDFVVMSAKGEERINLMNEEVVWVGYGIDAPDMHWHDYDGVDVRGKVVLGLVNDPPLDDGRFGGDALTYYGRWTYKREEATRRGAKASFLIHTDSSAGYPWAVVEGGHVGEAVTLAVDDEEEYAMSAAGWITSDTADRIASSVGSSLDEWIRSASTEGFRAETLPIKLNVSATFDIREFAGKNVIGHMKGNQDDGHAVVVSAHHDHLGIRPDMEGDNIYNGAVDNASGVALVLNLAQALSRIYAFRRVRYSVIFAIVTAEEKGLLGSQYFAEKVPALGWNLIANINLDAVNVWGPTQDVVGIGSDHSDDMKKLLKEAAEAENLSVSPDPEPEQGAYFRSDQLSFARQHVPGLMLDNGCEYVGKSDTYCQEVKQTYNELHYHRPSDEYNPGWDLRGAEQVARVALRIICELVADDTRWPDFNVGDEFRAD